MNRKIAWTADGQYLMYHHTAGEYTLFEPRETNGESLTGQIIKYDELSDDLARLFDPLGFHNYSEALKSTQTAYPVVADRIIHHHDSLAIFSTYPSYSTIC